MQTRPPHSFHAFIREKIEEILESLPVARPEDVLIIGSDCRKVREKGKVLPLYYKIPPPGSDARYYQSCWPDLLVCMRNAITGIIEIEESKDQKTSVTLFGKLIAASATSYYIPSNTAAAKRSTKKKEMNESIVFLHIAKSDKEDVKLDIIRNHIQKNIVPRLWGNIKDYKLLYGEEPDFEEDGRLRASFHTAIESMLN